MRNLFSQKRTYLSAGAVLLCLMIGFTGCNAKPEDEVKSVTEGPLCLSLTLSTNEVRIGDAFTASVRVVHPAGGQMTIPSPARGKELVVRDMSQQNEVLTTNETATVFRYQLSSFRTGSQRLWTNNAIFIQNDGAKWTVSLPETWVEVVSSIPEDAKPALLYARIKGVMDWPKTISLWVWIVLAVILILIAAIMIYYRSRRDKRPLEPAARPRPPYDVALEALHLLREKGLIEAHEVERFYVELSSIMRLYMENRFSLRAPEQTTEEFIHAAVRSRMLSTNQQIILQSFLEQSDLVKFAKHAPESSDMENAYQAAVHFVKETIPCAEPDAKEVSS
ncbi:MAG: hypothetical protein EOL87_10790 [Spartobacteria bacterium]|nr:hypothetical protein [Spartobacteria bacterium]